MGAAEELATNVARSGDRLEKIAKNFYGNMDEEMAFLFDTTCPLYLKYRERVDYLRRIQNYDKHSKTIVPTYVFKDVVTDMNNIEQYAFKCVAELKMKKIIDKRVNPTGAVEYLVSRNILDNTWKPAVTQSNTFKRLILEYEYERRFESKNTSINQKSNLAKDQCRLLHISQNVCHKEIVVGNTKLHGDVNYLVKMQGSLATYFIRSSEAKEKFSEKVIKYLESRIEGWCIHITGNVYQSLITKFGDNISECNCYVNTLEDW